MQMGEGGGGSILDFENSLEIRPIKAFFGTILACKCIQKRGNFRGFLYLIYSHMYSVTPITKNINIVLTFFSFKYRPFPKTGGLNHLFRRINFSILGHGISEKLYFIFMV